MIKAHPVAGNRTVGEIFLTDLRPYIWRKHLDFAAIHDIHSIKRQIDAHRGGGTVKVLGHNVKLGRGGIREIEFFAQTQQLIFGGRDPSLRLRSTCPTLRALSLAGHINPQATDEMIEAYGFLRRVEHRLQMIDDQQTHSIPDDEARRCRPLHLPRIPGLRVFRRRRCSSACAASRAIMPACSKRRRALPARAATWSSPESTTIPAL